LGLAAGRVLEKPGEGGHRGNDDADAATAAGTDEDIEIEHAVRQRGPGPGLRGDGGVGGWGPTTGRVRGRPTRSRSARRDDLLKHPRAPRLIGELLLHGVHAPARPAATPTVRP